MCHALLKRMNEVIDLDVTGDLKKKKNSRRGQVKTLKNGRFDQCVMYCYCEILLD